MAAAGAASARGPSVAASANALPLRRKVRRCMRGIVCRERRRRTGRQRGPESPIRTVGVAGVITGLALGLPHALLASELSVVVSAMTLTFIAGIYMGFAFLRGSEIAFGVELVAALGYALVALLGIVFSRWLIPLGLLAHSLWDFAHHNRHAALTDVPTWYVPFCIIVDVVLAALLIVIWRPSAWP